MASTYTSASTYTDHGVVDETSGPPIPFATVFSRAGGFRFEFSRGVPRPDSSYLIWTIGEQVFTALAHGNAELVPSLDFALGAMSGISSSTSSTIPALLMPGARLGSLLSQLDDPSVVGEDTIDGHLCWQVTGVTRIGTFTLSIDETSSLLRRLRREFPTPTGEYVSTATYQPELDAPVDAVQFAGPDIAAVPYSPPAPPPPASMPATDRWIGIVFDASLAVRRVIAGAPAAVAGLQAGDQIVSVNGHAATTMQDVNDGIRHTAIGARVHIDVRRANVNQVVRLAPIVAPRPAQQVARPASPPPASSKPAPDFTVDVISGSPDAHVQLADLKGHVVALDFWATWCGPCKMTMPFLTKLQREHAAQGLRVIGISIEDDDDIRKLAADTQLGYTVARDPTGTAWSAYGANAIPMLVIIDKHGLVQSVLLGAGHDDESEATVARLLKE